MRLASLLLIVAVVFVVVSATLAGQSTDRPAVYTWSRPRLAGLR